MQVIHTLQFLGQNTTYGYQSVFTGLSFFIWNSDTGKNLTRLQVKIDNIEEGIVFSEKRDLQELQAVYRQSSRAFPSVVWGLRRSAPVTGATRMNAGLCGKKCAMATPHCVPFQRARSARYHQTTQQAVTPSNRGQDMGPSGQFLSSLRCATMRQKKMRVRLEQDSRF